MPCISIRPNANSRGRASRSGCARKDAIADPEDARHQRHYAHRTQSSAARPRAGPVGHAGTEVEAALSAIKGELGLRYETDVQRLLRKVRTRYGTIELAYDTGILRAGALELPISELEFELVSGRPAAIFAAARGWQQRHGLVLDPRSKSERGDALAQLAQRLADADAIPGEDLEARRAQAIAQFWAPRGAAGVKLREDMTPSQAMARIAAECLDQIARNASVLAEVDTEDAYRAGNSEHVHQLRVRGGCVRPGNSSMAGSRPFPTPSCRACARTSPRSAPTATRTCQRTVAPALMRRHAGDR